MAAADEESLQFNTPPRLQPGISFSDQLDNTLHGTSASENVLCAVDWAGWSANDHSGSFILSVRRRGIEIARASACAFERLVLDIPSSIAAGETLVCELRWGSGVRHLHVIPILGPLSFCGLVTAHCEPRPSIADMSTLGRGRDTIGTLARNLCSPALPLELSKVDRGFGIELETLTVAGPGRPDALVAPNPGISAVIAALHLQLEECEHLSARSRASLARVRRWVIGEDGMICGSLEAATRHTLTACTPDDPDVAKTLLDAAPRVTHRTEIRTPPPPHELSFSERAADDIRCFTKLLRRSGCATPSIGRTHAFVSPHGACCDACTAIHVHVNVRNSHASGTLLSAREIVHVALAWIRFDHVTSRCTRPWMWRNVDSLPLLASGPECIRLKNEPSHTAERAGEANVPQWFEAVRRLMCEPSFDELDGATQVEVLFGDTSPARVLGRYCSLNLQSVSKHGTLEVRRHHGTLDGERLTHWAHLVVAFVETFRARDEEAHLLTSPLAEALAEMQAVQEAACAEELMMALAPMVDPETVEMLMADAVGEGWEPREDDDDEEEEGPSAIT